MCEGSLGFRGPRPHPLEGAVDGGSADAEEFADVVLTATRQGQEWVRAKVEAGEPSFVDMWDRFGLSDRYNADLTWLAGQRTRIAAALR